MANNGARAYQFLHLVENLGLILNHKSSILDLGCGNGSLVFALRAAGVNALGCDMSFKSGPEMDHLSDDKTIRKIAIDPYRLPFADGSFDVVVSDQVLEHVENLRETNREIHRILRHGGITIHIFPSRYTPIEPHVRVPLGTIIQNRYWLLFWHSVGIGTRAGKNEFENIVDQNYRYLKSCTHYRSHREINNLFRAQFGEVGNLENHFLTHKFKDQKVLLTLVRIFQVSVLYRIFRDRILYARKIEQK